MQKPLLIVCGVMLTAALSGCASTQPVPVCLAPPPPPARLMQPAPDLMTPLNGIISLSASE